jgi:3-oxoacyl-[acyl-carrier-protein] synthase II
VNSPAVVVVGMGAVTPIGIGLPEFDSGLRAGVCGVGPITSFDASGYRSSVAAEIRGRPASVHGPGTGIVQGAAYGRAAAFALAALAEALHGAGLHRSDLSNFRTGLCLGGSTAGTPEAEVELLDREADQDYWQVATPRRFLGTPVGTTADVLARAAGLLGPVSTLSTACSSATNAVGRGMEWLRSGTVDRAIVGGTDGFCRLTHSGFNALGLVAPERPLPFDARRQGMCIGEGAALFVLESEDTARARGAPILARLPGFGNRAEAHHLVQPREDGEGAARSMAAALADAGLKPEAVDYINAHGTATIQNDLSEARGIHAVFGAHSSQLLVSSTKSQVGHLLGASGAVELAATVLGMRGGYVPPNVGWEQEDPEIGLPIAGPTAAPAAVGVALSNSFAFGGNDATLCVVHPEVGQP